ncbi:tRNA pseudouridine synthase A [Halioglobus japonicus]|uniref:tRNA pseudouridine(38-40) synthase TruA n=1 Tax=Halioglobus japonicus TaxID=930805 RepID=UPI0019CC0C92|nr:tRNA pseudouridine(38-40) synthase TruA [Halioglobus japonicus]GHD11385.1 tRNA pseudouridine synthase A [Halioglobus japonicus]
MADPFPGLSAETLPAGTRIACRVEYNGANYNGWQTQPHLDVTTVQQELERGLTSVAGEPVRVHCAGRTDTGVHGHCQIVHFDAPVPRPPKSWVLGANASMARDVRVHWALPVEKEFHARFSATARRYRYVIANALVRPAMLGGQVTWQRRPLDEAIMHSEAQALLGERDFSTFRAAACQSTTPMRNMMDISVSRRGQLVVIDLQANAFLHHMVRNIAGSLMAVGSGRQSAGWIAELMEGRDRTVAADTAPPDGLYLVDVTYPGHFGLPQTPYGPLILGA